MTYQKAYKEIMSHITLRDSAQARIRQRLRTEASRSPRRSVRRAVLPAACLALMLTAGVFLVLPRQTPAPPTGSVSSGGSQIQSASSIEALCELVGFSVPEPDYLPFPVTQTEYTALAGNTAQIRYSNDTQDMTFRMTPGDEDPSGDYTDYPACQEISVNGVTVTLCGSGTDWSLAVWSHDGYTCSLRVSSPMDLDSFTQTLEGLL